MVGQPDPPRLLGQATSRVILASKGFYGKLNHRSNHYRDIDWWRLCLNVIGVDIDLWCDGYHQHCPGRTGYPGRIPQLLAAAIIIEGVLTNRVGSTYVELNAWYVTASVKIGNFYLPYIYVFGFLLSVFLLSCLYLLLYRTKFGYSLRASMQNRTAAELIGIDVERVSAITFGIGVALAAAGGVAFGATNLFNPNSHYDLISRLLVVIILGGLGSLRGALIASVAMLVIGDVTAVVWSPVWSSTVFFMILIIVLLLRPQGLFGQPEGRKQ